jgi:hypothetical protein
METRICASHPAIVSIEFLSNTFVKLIRNIWMLKMRLWQEKRSKIFFLLQFVTIDYFKF